MLALGPRVHELDHDCGTRVVDRIDHRLPGRGLRIGGDAGLLVITLGMKGIGIRAFRDDQPKAAAGIAAIIFDHLIGGPTVGMGAGARHRRYRGAVGQCQ